MWYLQVVTTIYCVNMGSTQTRLETLSTLSVFFFLPMYNLLKQQTKRRCDALFGCHVGRFHISSQINMYTQTDVPHLKPFPLSRLQHVADTFRYRAKKEKKNLSTTGRRRLCYHSRAVHIRLLSSHQRRGANYFGCLLCFLQHKKQRLATSCSVLNVVT